MKDISIRKGRRILLQLDLKEKLSSRWWTFSIAILLGAIGLLLFLCRWTFFEIGYIAILIGLTAFLIGLGVIVRPLKKDQENSEPTSKRTKKDPPKQVAGAREALLAYFGSQIRTHTTNIFTIIIAIFSSFQLHNIFNGTPPLLFRTLHTIIFSFLLTILFWQTIRVLYYSNLVSNVIIAKPFPKNHDKYVHLEDSEDYEVSLIKRLYDKTEEIIGNNKKPIVKLTVIFHVLNLYSSFILVGISVLIFVVSTIFLNYELITVLIRLLQ